MEEYAITVKDLKIRYKSVQAYSIKKSLLRLKGVEAKALKPCAASVLKLSRAKSLVLQARMEAANQHCFAHGTYLFCG